ncbi:MAG: hypothetical protein JOY80_05760, partial [Candidatus Dormibacteraeota bacterium]|nr:hypothetical protein [Candidatus Dormibacteraeota bacterium]
GGIAYVDRPLLNYVQHSRNALGYLAGTGALESRDTADADPDRGSKQLNSAAAARRKEVQFIFFTQGVRAMTYAREIEARCAAASSTRARRALRRLRAINRLRVIAWLAYRSHLKRHSKATLEAESRIMHVASWCWRLQHLPRRATANAESLMRATYPNPPRRARRARTR